MNDVALPSRPDVARQFTWFHAHTPPRLPLSIAESPV
jgi:hypothetical protein